MNFFQKYPKHKLLLVLIDFILIHISFILALKAKFLGTIDIINVQEISIAKEWLNFIPYSFIMIFYFQYSNFYKFQNIVSPGVHVHLVFTTIIKAICGYVLYQLVLGDINIESRLYYIYFTCILCTLFIPVRIYFVELIRKTPHLMDNIVIVGMSERGAELSKTFSDKSNLYNVVGFIDDHASKKPINHPPLLGKVRDADQVAKKYGIQSFVLAFDNISRKRFFDIFQYFHQKGLVLAVSSDYLNILHQKHDGLDIYEKFELVRFCANDRHKMLIVVKRLYDIIFSLVGLILLFPLFLIISILVKLSSPGPILYSEQRIGKDGKAFKFYKFRTMVVGSDQDEKRDQNIENFIKGNLSQSDSTKVVTKENVTKTGLFLRKHSLDEFPQLLNVLKGDMSLVGARPCIEKEWGMYEDWQRLRLSMTPGCTGIWQVHARSKVNFEESILMDIYYNQNFTPWWDTKLILQTIPVLLFGTGGE